MRKSFVSDEPSPASEPASVSESREQVFEGGCFCGRVRYLIRDRPRSPSICHCTMCRRASGAPCVAWATFRTAQIEWLRGSPQRRKSSETAERSFCSECGTALTFMLFASPEYTDVTLGSLDAPESITPADHIYTTSQVPWLQFSDGLPRFPEERGNDDISETPGESSETP